MPEALLALETFKIVYIKAIQINSKFVRALQFAHLLQPKVSFHSDIAILSTACSSL